MRPPRLGGNVRMGVFATRSPFRPNPIGLSSVRLESVEFSAALQTAAYRAGQPTKALRDIRSTVHKKAGSVSTSPQQTRMVFGKSQRKKPAETFHIVFCYRDGFVKRKSWSGNSRRHPLGKLPDTFQLDGLDFPDSVHLHQIGAIAKQYAGTSVLPVCKMGKSFRTNYQCPAINLLSQIGLGCIQRQQKSCACTVQIKAGCVHCTDQFLHFACSTRHDSFR